MSEKKDQKLAHGLFYAMHVKGKTSAEAAQEFGMKEAKAVKIMNAWPEIRQAVLQAFEKQAEVSRG